MVLPPNLHKKYLARFDELIEEGEAIKEKALQMVGIRIYDPAFQDLLEWKIKCISLLAQVVPQNHPYHNKWMDDLSVTQVHDDASGINTIACNRGLAYLRAISSDLEAGILNDLRLEIEVEISVDYMGQAEQLLTEGQRGQYDHVPAAVLAGAVLEKGLRAFCDKQVPSIATMNSKGTPLTLSPLIEELKKAGLYNELKAKQLRAWADIRNAAAHGEFDKFKRADVEGMIRGVSDFLATYY